MSLETMLNLTIMILGILVAIAPWTFAPVCVNPMQCWTTREVETIFGGLIAILALFGAYRSLD